MKYCGGSSAVTRVESANALEKPYAPRLLQKKSGPEARSSFLMRTSSLHSAAVRPTSTRQVDSCNLLLRHG